MILHAVLLRKVYNDVYRVPKNLGFLGPATLRKQVSWDIDLTTNQQAL